MFLGRSYQAHALQLHLPGLGEPDYTPHATITRTWEGYSALLDASDEIWAFGKAHTEQVATVLQRRSGRSVWLTAVNPDELLNLPGAIQILPGAVAVARTSYLDIYDMSTILSALDSSSIRRSKPLHPTQTLAYPVNWTANHLNFAPTRPGWVRATEHNPDDIYLIFTEPYLDAWVALVARRTRNPNEEESKHRFEEPYYLFTPQSYATTAMNWGESTRRLAYVANDIGKILLVGACMPSNPGLFGSYQFNAERITKSWSIPEGGIDYAKSLAFDEYTGISAISMASGRLWIIDPVVTVGRMQIPGEGLKTISASLDSNEEFDWSTSVEKYFPGKNRPDCFGGAKWFVNEILHIEGSARTVLFTIPDGAAFPTLEVVQAGQRLLLIRRDEDTCRYEVKALTVDTDLEDVLGHFRSGGTASILSVAHKDGINGL
ncbi:hypothetical protein FS837_008843 [Tulasnella sp. UAMH 9824]|nr:hypothetical protein FS837_008843 [Tulasnella sp. UAMH 9824]